MTFTPPDTYRNLTPQQHLTCQGQPFHPSVIIEVEDVCTSLKLEELTSKIENEYFPAGIELGLLVDPMTPTVFTFKKDIRGVAWRRNCRWRDVACGDVLPGFILQVWKTNEAASQVCYCCFSYASHQFKASNSLFGLTTEVIRARVNRW